MENVANAVFGIARKAVLTTRCAQAALSFSLRELSHGTVLPLARCNTRCPYGSRLTLREPDGHRVHYRANGANPVFPDLLAATQKTCGLPVMMGRALAPLGERVRFAAIYGSVAKGGESASQRCRRLAMPSSPH